MFATLLLPAGLVLQQPPHRSGDTAWRLPERCGRLSGVAPALVMSAIVDTETNATLRQGIQAQRLAGKSDREIIESDMVKDLLRANSDLLDADVPLSLDDVPSVPRTGDEPWGRWVQTADKISLEVFIGDGVRARDIRCEVSVGFVDVRIGDDPLLSGRLAQPVLSELEWLLDPDARDAGQLLTVELVKRTPSKAVNADGDFSDAIFKSLKVRTVSGKMSDCYGLGLVAGHYVPIGNNGVAGNTPEEVSEWY